MSLTDLCFKPGIMQDGLMKAVACFIHDSWSPERGLRSEPPAAKQKILPIRLLRFVKDVED
jgi:hypothetical protein